MSCLRRRLLGSLVLGTLIVPGVHAEHAERAPQAAPAPDELGELSANALDDAALLDALAMVMPAPDRSRQRPARRFSNGPRNVARVRGAALARAQALGIGDTLSTKQLLWSRPSQELLAAVRGPAPKSLLWPVLNGKWGRGFGFTRKVRTELRHNGIDIGAPLGTAVRAAADGLVIYSDNTLRDLGNAVMILHAGGLTTLYAHNLRTTVQPGYYVKRGERIALIGQTGAAWGPHLHFELRDNGRWRDPEPLIVGYRDLELNGPLVALDGAIAAAKPPAKAATRNKRASGSDSASDSDSDSASDSDSDSDSVSVSVSDSVSDSDSDSVSVSVSVSAPTRAQPALPLKTGTLAAARRLLRQSPPAIEDEAQLGRRFRNLLFPVKGGRERSAFDAARHRAIDIDAEFGAPVRAVADGVVVYSGEELGALGRTIVVWHRDGWVTVYGCVSAEAVVEPGTRVLRGEWIGRVGHGEDSTRPHLHFEWIERGERRDPSRQFVGR